ncbi:MAG: hypothetical protein ABIH68_05280 [bacterium]
MNIKEYFSEKEIERINKLSGPVRIAELFVISAISIFLFMAVINFYSAIQIGRIYGITDFSSILSVSCRNIEVDKIYKWHEFFIAEHVSKAHLYLVFAIISLMFYYILQRTDNLLLKCRKLLFPENKNT